MYLRPYHTPINCRTNHLRMEFTYSGRSIYKVRLTIAVDLHQISTVAGALYTGPGPNLVT